ncbi:MAG: EutN/CcmL family microcompartment protein [Bacteroidetes bacterium]|nr:EutN/CcmL family microcompartment protein [Bacteroidota bacterium]MBL6944786.1 EutN/CcmL family microcompartment protein [Bacteroidales bacterium]
MRLGKVIGTVVSSTKAKGYESRKILVIQPVNPKGSFTGTSFLAIDAVQAGVDDLVLCIEEGNSARQVIRDADAFTVKTVVAAIVDEISS